MPGPSSPCSAYLLEADEFRLLVDFGTGSMGALQRLRILYDVDAIILSHLHPDHCSDTASYVVARHYYAGKQLPPVPLYGPAGARDRIKAIGGPGIAEHVDSVYEFSSLLRGTLDIGPFHVTVGHVNHPVETFGMRFEHQGRVLTYSADTGQSETLVKLASEADLFLCEASYPHREDNPQDVHLSGVQAGEHAAAAGVKRLLLTHLVSTIADELDIAAEARSRYDGPVEVARSHWTYDV